MNSLNCAGGSVKRAIGSTREYQKHYRRSYELTREAVKINRPQQLEEANTVFRELSEVLVDHVERWLKHGVQNSRHLGCQQRLQQRREEI